MVENVHLDFLRAIYDDFHSTVPLAFHYSIAWEFLDFLEIFPLYDHVREILCGTLLQQTAQQQGATKQTNCSSL